ncbi:interleukin-31 receptor subunit alpha isoform X2 [Sparus aurata]|uniref:interleukin-31 receptor subunit alpha isoform X2 n=1 Tax=Sparus aurata TaxID=8175 RepID=UPI0011C1C577|nr:interleukin-31 receptor subunit alpha-like isoform X2 [Sparus aurata]
MRTANGQSCRDRLVSMEGSPAVVWTCLLGAALILVSPPAFSMATSRTAPRPPQLHRCEFHHRANVTCYWEAGDADTRLYTLNVLRIPLFSNITTLFSCTTSDTSCTVQTESSVKFKFCISVTAQGQSQDARATSRCQSGMIEVKLPPVTVESVKPVRGRPRCLEVTWKRSVAFFPLSDYEVTTGELKSQIEFTSQGQFDVQVENVSVRNYSFLACPRNLRPDTSYTVRLRHSYRDANKSPWSLWSNACEGKTAEGAPSAAPRFWRRVDRTEKDASRLVTLLWKPLPHSLANGRVLFYNVTCRTEITRILNDRGSCGDLLNTSTSCSLRLPAGRWPCALTASTSAGTSPTAWIWLVGPSETETQLPMNITATPLSDSSLDVRWTAPADRATGGFVVEWFPVTDQTSSALHWERLNSSCRALVITEGVKPRERYVVSVKALHDEEVVGQTETVIYTRQGTPSAGPAVKLEKISGSAVALSWDPVPVELLHGFIRSYVVSYSTGNRSENTSLPADTRLYSLENLSPGAYNICVQAVTDAGAGAGSSRYMHIASEDLSILMLALPPLMLTPLALVLIACVVKSTTKHKLCGYVPDPSNSSLASWMPKVSLEKRPVLAEKIGIKYSDLVLCKDKLQHSSSERDLSYQGICDLQTYSTHCCYSPLPVSGTLTPQNTKSFECIQNSTRAKTTSNTDLSSYSKVLFSQDPRVLPIPLQSTSYVHSNHWQHSAVSVNDAKLPPGGDSEPSVSLQGRVARFCSPLSQTDELKTISDLLGQNQSPVSDFGSVFHSSVLLSHRADATSPQTLFCQSLYSSVPSLQLNTIPRPDAPSDALTMLYSPVPDLPPPIFVDFSYCRLDCDP